jgi:hypothetical protein
MAVVATIDVVDHFDAPETCQGVLFAASYS